ncbi:chorismate mutase [Candidatus Bathyarchaeota archaeon]|nr:chorismate mutase [Candidatus Bathyarchaeota archaeon]
MSENEDLKNLRNEMTKITLEIIRLSGKRLVLARKIGEIKARRGMEVEDPKVEQELKNKVIELSREHNIDTDFSLKILNLLIEESKQVQRDVIKEGNKLQV